MDIHQQIRNLQAEIKRLQSIGHDTTLLQLRVDMLVQQSRQGKK